MEIVSSAYRKSQAPSHLRPILGREFIVPKPPIMLLLAEPLNLLDLLRRQLERARAQIIAQSRLLAARGDGHDALIHAPPQTDLPLADIIFLGQLRHVLVQRARLGLGDGSERGVGGGGDVGGGVLVGEEGAVLQVGVVFDLVDGGRDGGCCEGGLEVDLQVVGHADRFGFAGFLDGFHFGPGVLEVGGGFGEEGGVDEVACPGNVSWRKRRLEEMGRHTGRRSQVRASSDSCLWLWECRRCW